MELHFSLLGILGLVLYAGCIFHAIKTGRINYWLLILIFLPGLGSIGGFSGRRSDRETFYLFTSYTSPGTIYRYDLVTGRSTLFSYIRNISVHRNTSALPCQGEFPPRSVEKMMPP